MNNILTFTENISERSVSDLLVFIQQSVVNSENYSRNLKFTVTDGCTFLNCWQRRGDADIRLNTSDRCMWVRETVTTSYISTKLLEFESIGERMMEEIWSERVWNVVKIFVTLLFLSSRTTNTRCEEKGKQRRRKQDSRTEENRFIRDKSQWKQTDVQCEQVNQSIISMKQIINVQVRHDRWIKQTNRRHREESLVSFCRQKVFTEETQRVSVFIELKCSIRQTERDRWGEKPSE